MRILQIIPSLSLIYGGPSQMVLGLSQALASEGIDVTIITTNANGDQGQLPLTVPLGTPVRQDGYQVIYFRCSPWRRYKFSLGLLTWLYRNANNYDLAHIHALFSPVSTAAAKIARYRQLPYILRPLGTLDPADLCKKKQLKQIYAYLWERDNLAHAQGIHFTSEQECQISERFGCQTKDLIRPLGVNIPSVMPKLGQGRQKLGINEQSLLILFMSRLDPKKGLELLMTALENIYSDGVDFQLVLAGSNPQNQEYEQQIKTRVSQSVLKSRTHFTGFVEGEYKYELLRDADLFVLPSYYENFGIAVVEAMAMGTPVVVSKQVYIYEDIAPGGWVCDNQAKDLTKVLLEACQNEQLRREKGEKAQKIAQEKYSWQAIAQQMITAYQNKGKTE
ncbi:MAG: glycosyltransferase [Gloeocapsa sp. DLM2.Bin57]|nr:MAG: glycosyltransferase [Gloeocapsa sp. DLM2.Bin57]